MKIAIIGNTNTNHFKKRLSEKLILVSQDCEFYEAPFNSLEIMLKSSESQLFKFEANYIFIILDVHYYEYSERLNLRENVDIYLSFVSAILDSVFLNSDAIIILNNFVLPPFSAFQSYDTNNDSRIGFTYLINYELIELSKKFSRLIINDIFYTLMSNNIKAYNSRDFYEFGYSISVRALNEIANSSFNLLKSHKRSPIKIIIVDLDNTIWGGLIGDDGIDGIKLGGETSSGSRYLNFQKFLKSLVKRGILLALVSKNDYLLAIEGFNHINSILSLSDFVSVKINWNPKSLNIKQLLSELNLSASDAIFIDDSEFERNEVETNIRDLNIVHFDQIDEVEEEISGNRILDRRNILEVDLNKNNQYQDEQYRRKEQLDFNDYGEYLKSLGLKLTINISNPNYERVSQLLIKTNQFNFNKLYLSSEDLKAQLKKKTIEVFQFSLRDKIGDYGIISALLFKMSSDTIFIENWVMSCRVFSRNLEFVIFNFLTDYAMENCKQKIIVEFIQSERNIVLIEIIKKLGFVYENSNLWEYRIDKLVTFKNDYYTLVIDNNE